MDEPNRIGRVVKKHVLPPIPALGNMVGYAGNNNSCKATHAMIYTEMLKQCAVCPGVSVSVSVTCTFSYSVELKMSVL